jgi:delta 1-pyrroline-5-carboxylate dehydrogenase
MIWRRLCGRLICDGRYSVVPWNAPIPLIVIAVAIPLICGNTVLVRPSEYCPYTSSLVVEALHGVRELSSSSWNKSVLISNVDD